MSNIQLSRNGTYDRHISLTGPFGVILNIWLTTGGAGGVRAVRHMTCSPQVDHATASGRRFPAPRWCHTSTVGPPSTSARGSAGPRSCLLRLRPVRAIEVRGETVVRQPSIWSAGRYTNGNLNVRLAKELEGTRRCYQIFITG